MLNLKIIYLFTLFSYAFGTGELSILQTPDSLSFSGQEQLDLSNVKNVLSAALGFTIPEGPRWSGLVITDPFNLADAIAVVSVPGVPSLDSVQGRTYPLITDEPLQNTWKALSWRLEDRFPTASNLTLNYLSLDQPAQAEEMYGSLGTRDPPSVENLKPNLSEDKAFINQINLIDSITAKVADKGISNDGVPDIHWFNVPGLHTLIDTYGSRSKQVNEAKRLLSSSILLLSEVFMTAYNDKVLFVVISSDVVHTRRFRRSPGKRQTGDKPEPGLPSEETVPSADESNVENPSSSETPPAEDTQVSEDEIDPNYPVMFNIFLWFGISYFMVLLATTMGIARMDPGRDSIIYRMTSNRMKKDN